ncbi:MAG: beta-lactamase family protein [Planctomycetota bacterium]|nr:MAG: beta-lactamase family protein [Planctomycetota bacterium]
MQQCAIAKKGLARATPEEVGLSSQRLERINKVMQGYVDENKVAGIVTMVARRGKVAHFECFGVMDIETKKPMQADTIFRIYSMSKPVTSVAVMMLYEEGHFQLNDPVSKFIPEFKDVKVFVRKTDSGVEVCEPKREITIYNLLTHTSGLAYGLSKETVVDEMYEEAEIFGWEQTLKEMIGKLVKLPLANQPGSKWKYSISVDVLGYLVEVISGMRFDEFLEERIFEPLEMKDSGFYVPDEKMGRAAALYKEAKSGGLEPGDTDKWGRFTKSTRFFSGGGGLVSTAPDYMRFCQMLLNGGELDGVRLLSRKSVELMTTNNLPDELLPYGGGDLNGYGFGLGFAVIMDASQTGILGTAGQYSWGGAASTGFWVDPEEELIGIFMTQFMPYTGRFTQELKVLTYQAIVD